MNTILKCKHCSATFISDWQRQKAQYEKIRRRNYSHDEAREILPSCSTCLKKWFQIHSTKVESIEGVEA